MLLFMSFCCILFQMEDLQKELEEQKELANNRIMELETLNTQHKEALKLVEKLKMDVCLLIYPFYYFVQLMLVSSDRKILRKKFYFSSSEEKIT